MLTGNGREVVLPVTPESFEVGHGTRIETVNIHTVGDVSIAGFGATSTIKVSCMLPAQNYPFASGGDPYDYIDTFRRWIDNRYPVRFIVSDTGVNVRTYMEDVQYGEKDGTNDVYVTITLREAPEIKAVKVQSSKQENNARSAGTKRQTAQSYVVQDGDCLIAICRKFYGDGSVYSQLAKYNGIKNPNLIYTGNVIKIPDKSLL